MEMKDSSLVIKVQTTAHRLDGFAALPRNHQDSPTSCRGASEARKYNRVWSMPFSEQRAKNLSRLKAGTGRNDRTAHRKKQRRADFGHGREREKLWPPVGGAVMIFLSAGSSSRRRLKKLGAPAPGFTGVWGRLAANKQASVYTDVLLLPVSFP